MSTTLLPITLTSAGAMGLLNAWLAFRVGQVRQAAGISVGDGGDDRVIRRMRAHANFTEFAPLVLALIGLIEFTAGTSLWLWIVAGLFLIGRIAHPFGMDGVMRARMIGIAITLLTTIGLSLYAITLPFMGQRVAERPAPPAMARG